MTKKDRDMLQKLEQERSKLHRQIEALQNEVRGLDRAIALYATPDATKRERPKNVKATVIKIVQDAGLIGLSANEVVEAALNAGTHLEKPTVASHLSRLKLEGVLEMREGRYVYRAPAPTAPGWPERTAH